MTENEKINREIGLFLTSIPSIGNKTIEKLNMYFGDMQAIYKASDKELGKVLKPKQLEAFEKGRREIDISKATEKIEKMGIKYVTLEDTLYPERIRNIPDPPYILFYYGELPDENIPSVAIIGARECSDYGRYVARGLGEALAGQGISVISGMARGIDSISQEAAVEHNGRSYAVLGCGVDICYPSESKRLYDALKQRGGIISSYYPGTQPVAQNFPPRNRIVSGFADIVIVVEARRKSGTLITVDMALEQGKDIYVVPGRITDRLSDGCNNLIKQGAGVILSPEDFLEELRNRGILTDKGQESNGAGTSSYKNNGDNEAVSDARVINILAVMDYYPKGVDEIRRALSFDCNQTDLNSLLMKMCVEGLITQVSAGFFKLKN